jgi:hypothetical protein
MILAQKLIILQCLFKIDQFKLDSAFIRQWQNF